MPVLLLEEETRVQTEESLVAGRGQHDLFLVEAQLDRAAELPLLHGAILRVQVHHDLVVRLQDNRLERFDRGETRVRFRGQVLPVVIVTALDPGHPAGHLGYGQEVDVLEARQAPARVAGGIPGGGAVLREALEMHVLVRDPLGQPVGARADHR